MAEWAQVIEAGEQQGRGDRRRIRRAEHHGGEMPAGGMAGDMQAVGIETERIGFADEEIQRGHALGEARFQWRIRRQPVILHGDSEA